MRFTLPQRTIVLIISAIFFSLAFEPSPLWFLAYFFVPIFAASIRGLGFKEGFRSGYVFGVISAVLGLYWVVYVNVVGVILLVLLHSFYYALIGGLAAESLKRYGRLGLWTLPVLWVAMEYLRSLSQVSFPWQNISYTQASNIAIVQLAEISGDATVTFFVCVVGLVLYFAYANLRRIMLSSSLFVVAIMLYSGAYIWGVTRIHPVEPDFEVAALQGNIPVNDKWQNGKADHNFVAYDELSARVSDSAQLLIWPESAAPMYLNLERPYIAWIESIARRENVDIMTGGLYMTRTAEGVRKYYNSAFFFTPQGMLPTPHNKLYLVPFGEHMPYAEKIKPIAKFREFVKERLALDISDFQPGDSIVTFESHGRKFGTLICFEVVYPEFVREMVNKGVDFLAVITNDDWFGETAGPYQHFYIPVFRAVENRVWIVRAANTGICGIFDPYGRVVAKTQLGGRTFLTGKIGPRMGETMFQRWGAVLGKICLAMAVLAGIILTITKRRHG
ncbi:MAG: apolipoprotein N-acyltransferase [Candidatus Zixiibacteriota bacterium]